MALEAVGIAFGEVFSRRNYLLLGLAASAFFLFLFAAVEVYTIPGNTFDFWLENLSEVSALILLVLALGMGAGAALQTYAWRHGAHTYRSAGAGVVGAFSGILASIFSSAACASCVGALFSFLGAGGVITLINHRWEFSLLGLALVAGSIYLSSQKVANHCESCRVPTGRHGRVHSL
jgi:hypothetical protein